MLFLWAEWCGDCKDQAADFRRTVEKYAPQRRPFRRAHAVLHRGPRGGKAPPGPSLERILRSTDGVSIPIADEAMLRYGVSSTPTFAMIDKAGIVRFYSPTRMTEQRLGVEIEKLLRP